MQYRCVRLLFWTEPVHLRLILHQPQERPGKLRLQGESPAAARAPQRSLTGGVNFVIDKLS